jgi:hypothetical protein
MDRDLDIPTAKIMWALLGWVLIFLWITWVRAVKALIRGNLNKDK